VLSDGCGWAFYLMMSLLHYQMHCQFKLLAVVDEHVDDDDFPIHCNRQHLNSGGCLEDKREDNQNCSVLCFV